MKDIDFPVVIKLKRGVDADNGATPWYSEVKLGEEKQPMNFAFDSGTSYSWVTSNRCTTKACLMHERYKFNSSQSFRQMSDQFDPIDISFGPWGNMEVSSGSDVLAVHNDKNDKTVRVEDYTLFLSHSYDGTQFENLVWDGAIGMPSTVVENPNMPETSKFFSLLIQNKKCKHKKIKFNYHKKCVEVGTDETDVKPKLKLRVKEKFEDLWFLNLDKVMVNGLNAVEEATKEKGQLYFCIDTGSSRFKGDRKIIREIIQAITFDGQLPIYIAKKNPSFGAYPVIQLIIEGHSFELKPQDYFERISDELYILGFCPLDGLDDILLVGSVFLEKFNPVFYYGEDGETGTSIGFIPQKSHKDKD